MELAIKGEAVVWPSRIEINAYITPDESIVEK